MNEETENPETIREKHGEVAILSKALRLRCAWWQRDWLTFIHVCADHGWDTAAGQAD